MCSKKRKVMKRSMRILVQAQEGGDGVAVEGLKHGTRNGLDR